MKVIFSNRAYAAVMAETTEKIQTETGGLFLGAVENDIFYIVEAIDPGPDSIFEVAYFEYDQQYTQHLINKIANLYQKRLDLIGLWHRHPGSFDVFSSTDDGTNAKYARMRPEGAVSALVNIDPDFRLTVYHVGQPCRYRNISYEVGDDKIPEKYLKLKTPQQYKSMMRRAMFPETARDLLEPSISLDSFMKTIKPLFKANVYDKGIGAPSSADNTVRDKIIQNLLTDILFLSDEVGIKMSVAQSDNAVALVQDTVDGIKKLFFGYSEKEDAFFFQYNGEKYIYQDGLLKKLYQEFMNSKENGRGSNAEQEQPENDEAAATGNEDTRETGRQRSKNIIYGLFHKKNKDE